METRKTFSASCAGHSLAQRAKHKFLKNIGKRGVSERNIVILYSQPGMEMKRREGGNILQRIHSPQANLDKSSARKGRYLRRQNAKQFPISKERPPAAKRKGAKRQGGEKVTKGSFYIHHFLGQGGGVNAQGPFLGTKKHTRLTDSARTRRDVGTRGGAWSTGAIVASTQ